VSTTELHPDNLLEREALGELSGAERAQLDAHLARCAACRLERVARMDFLRESERLARETPADVQRLLARVLAAPPPVERVLVAPRPSRASRRVAALLLAGVVVSAAGWAAAALWSPGPAELPGDARSTPGSARVVRAAHASGVRAESAPLVTRDVAEDDPPVVEEVRPQEGGKAGSSEGPPAPRPSTILAARATTPPEPESAASSFQAANEARRSSHHADAAKAYRALIARYPSSAEARASLVALGRMLLDDDDASGALQCFDDYLRGGGAMTEDVMLARSVALQRLGRSDDEARAWSALLGEYPASVHAERARRRLLDLGKM
jgi:TolA-binding protein